MRNAPAPWLPTGELTNDVTETAAAGRSTSKDTAGPVGGQALTSAPESTNSAIRCPLTESLAPPPMMVRTPGAVTTPSKK